VFVYLRSDTWSAPGATIFAGEVLRAKLHKKPLLLAHEDLGVDAETRRGAIIERLIASTPKLLVQAQLYSIIAVPLRGGHLRHASMEVLFKVLNAVVKRRPNHWLSMSSGKMPRPPLAHNFG
jgi:hypothetical protein